MFKIESYITPILINYVAKYVKNIRPEDAQLSLWEGEANFHNLELNLDVLQQELNLPVEFLSGHIHDLSIYVPWTKITSEPIRITINTIEFVLKLKDTKEASSGSSTGSSPQHQHDAQEKKRALRREDSVHPAQQYAGAGAGLVNKIINNISIDCQNIILKYVEEDMVLSMNVQLLSLRAANENWQPAMMDVHPVSVLMRKLITISDLTICLDKRNAAGRIDVSQEPILYRCTFELRIVHKYKSNTVKTTSTLRVGIYTKLMDMNVSSLQFPMVMRLFELVQVLQKRVTNSQLAEEEHVEDIEEPSVSEASAGSYLSWAWNMLPSFTGEPIDDEEQGADGEHVGHTVEMSFYMEEFNFTLKQSELIPDSIMAGARRIRYSPIVRVHLCGIYVEFLNLNEKSWTNIKGGISNLDIEPLGAFRGDEKWCVTLVNSPALTKNVGSFKDKSLFDENLTKNDKMLWNVTNFSAYCERFTDEYLCYRTPVFAFDRVEYKSMSSSSAHGSANDVSVELNEASGINTSVQMRFMSSGLKICYNKAFQQVWNVISDYIKSYDYSAYHTANPKVTDEGKLHPPLMEDYDALMAHIPLCKYHVKVNNLTLEWHAKLESDAMTGPTKVPRKFPSYFKPQFPFFCLRLKSIGMQLTSALRADKLVHTTCQLPDKPEELLNACYDSYAIDLLDLEIYLQQLSGEFKAQLVKLPQLHMSFGSLLKPHLWQNDEICVQKLNVSCQQLSVSFSKRQLLLTQLIANCIKSYEPHLLQKALQLLNARDNQDADLVKLHIDLNQIGLQQQSFHSYKLLRCTLLQLQMSVELETQRKIIFDTEDENKNWLECHVQLPDKTKDADGIIIMLMWLNKYRLDVDNNMLKFLSYAEPKSNDEIGKLS